MKCAYFCPNMPFSFSKDFEKKINMFTLEFIEKAQDQIRKLIGSLKVKDYLEGETYSK